MKIAIFSDIHDNLNNLHKAIQHFNHLEIGAAIFCGDFCSPMTIKALKILPYPVHCVFGNGDGDRFAISNIVNLECPKVKLYGEYADIEIEGTRVAINHYPLLARGLAFTQDYSAVFFGHTHSPEISMINKCLLVNPGEIMGWKGAPTFGIYDPIGNKCEIVTLQ